MLTTHSMIHPASQLPTPKHGTSTLVLLALALTCFIAQIQPLLAQSIDERADRYLDAYMLFNEGTRLEQAGNLEDALRKWRESSQLFDMIARNHPGWEANKMEMRRRKVADAISTAEKKLLQAPSTTASTTPAPTPTNPLLAAPATDSPPAQPTPSPTQTTTPPTAGNWGSEPAASAGLPTLTDFIRQYDEQMRAQFTELQRKNLDMEAALRKWDEWYRWASREIQIARTEKDTLAARSTDLEGRMQQMQRELQAGQATQDQYDMLLKEKAALTALEKQNTARMQAAETAAAEAQKRLASSEKEIAALNQQITTLTTERDQAIQERDTALASSKTMEQEKTKLEAQVAELSKQSNIKALNDLRAENDKLKQELAQTKEQVTQLLGDLSKKDTEIATLKTELTSFQERLADLQQQNTAYQTQVSELTIKLKDLEAAMNSDTDDPVLAEENQLLRTIVLRQLRTQARQQQAKALIIEELQQLEGASEQLLSQVKAMDEGRLTLDDKEQALFRDPQIQDLVQGGRPTVQATLMASGSDPGSADSNLPTEPGADLSVDALLAEANAHAQARRYMDAIQSFQEVLRADPASGQALLGLGEAYQRTGQFTESEAALKKCITFDPANSRAHFHLGLTLYRSERLNDSIKAFEESLKLDSKQSLAHHYLGMISNRLKQNQRAEKEFRTALAIDPSFGEAHFNLAVLYTGWDPPRWDDARNEYAQALTKGVQADTALEKILAKD